MATTLNAHSTDRITVTDEVRDASDAAGDQVIIVAIESDGTQTILDQSVASTVAGEDSAYWGTVALVEGYVDEDSEWSETSRHARQYWTVVTEVGAEERHASRIDVAV